jgi:predicted ester cyclase
MSADDNLKATRQVIAEAFNKGNYEVLRTYLHPDYLEHQFGSQPNIEGVQNRIEKLRQAFPDLHFSIEELVAQEDKVWLRMTARGTNQGGFMGPPNNKSFEITVFDQVRFQDGLIIEHWGSPDRFALLVQLEKLPQRFNRGGAKDLKGTRRVLCSHQER